MDILVVGNIGIAGTVNIAARYKEEILKKYPVTIINEIAKLEGTLGNFDIEEVINRMGLIYYPILECGLYGALWSLWEDREKGFTIRLENVPIKQETIEICELFDINPYGLLSGNSYLVIAENGEKVRESFSSAGYIAELIGQITEVKDKLVLYENKQLYLTKPKRDEMI